MKRLNWKRVEYLASAFEAWKSKCTDVQITLANFERPQSITEEQGSIGKKVK